MIHRGTQYVRAIKRFYKKFGRYPTTLEQLEKTNNIRFLRRRYKDPITGKDDWRLIHVGESKVQPKTFSQGGSAGSGATAAGAAGAGSIGAGIQGAARMAGSMGMSGGISGATSNVGTPVSSMSSPAGGRVIGGGAIIGVSSLSEAESLKELNEQKHYNQWEFVYDPRLDPTMQNQGIPGIRPGQLGPGQLGPGTLGGPGQQGPGIGPTRR